MGPADAQRVGAAGLSTSLGTSKKTQTLPRSPWISGKGQDSSLIPLEQKQCFPVWRTESMSRISSRP